MSCLKYSTRVRWLRRRRGRDDRASVAPAPRRRRWRWRCRAPRRPPCRWARVGRCPHSAALTRSAAQPHVRRPGRRGDADAEGRRGRAQRQAGQRQRQPATRQLDFSRLLRAASDAGLQRHERHPARRTERGRLASSGRASSYHLLRRRSDRLATRNPRDRTYESLGYEPRTRRTYKFRMCASLAASRRARPFDVLCAKKAPCSDIRVDTRGVPSPPSSPP